MMKSFCIAMIPLFSGLLGQSVVNVPSITHDTGVSISLAISVCGGIIALLLTIYSREKQFYRALRERDKELHEKINAVSQTLAENAHVRDVEIAQRLDDVADKLSEKARKRDVVLTEKITELGVKLSEMLGYCKARQQTVGGCSSAAAIFNGGNDHV